MPIKKKSNQEVIVNKGLFFFRKKKISKAKLKPTRAERALRLSQSIML